MSPDPSSMTLYEPQSNPYAGHAKKLDEQLQLYIESGPNFDVSPGAKSKIIVLGNSGECSFVAIDFPRSDLAIVCKLL